MKKHLLLAGVAAFSMASARAELITDYKQIKFDFIFKWGASYGPSAGSLTLKLNDDGTIHADLDAADSVKWIALGLDSSTRGVNYFSTISGFTGNGRLIVNAQGTPMTTMATGLTCSPYCTGSASWTFGKAGQFSSFNGLLDGGHTYWGNIGATPAYFRLPTTSYYGGWNYVQVEKPDAPPPSRVPEPASVSLAGVGLLAIAALHRRSRRRA